MAWADVENKREAKEKTPYTKLETGATTIRILDNEPYSFWSHWFNKQQTSVTCLGKGCPVCDVIAAQKANPDMEKKYTNSQRHAIRVWNYKTNQMEVMIQGKNFFSQLLTFHREIGDITTYDIKVVKNGSGKDTSYTLIPQRPEDFGHANEAYDINMEEMFKPLEKEVVLQLMEGKTWKEIFPSKGNE